MSAKNSSFVCGITEHKLMQRQMVKQCQPINFDGNKTIRKMELSRPLNAYIEELDKSG
jgi:hypothetical protein